MKIVAIMGSPRKGDTYKTTKMIEDYLKQMGKVDFEYLHLKDADIKLCTGCHTCFLKGEDRCPLKDDVQPIRRKMLEADGIIIATPVYSQQVTALLKNLLDRLSYLYHRPEMFRQKGLMLTSSAGGTAFKDMFKYMKSNSEAWGMTVTDVVGMSMPGILKPKAEAKEMDRLKKATMKFYYAISDKRLPKPGLFKLIWFTVWKTTVQLDKTTYDYKHWSEKGWLDKNTYYYYNTKVNIFKKGIERLMEKMIKRFFKKNYI
jgi:multimeric flavodoxin WrbA